MVSLSNLEIGAKINNSFATRFEFQRVKPRILDILILQDKTLFCAFEAGDIVC